MTTASQESVLDVFVRELIRRADPDIAAEEFLEGHERDGLRGAARALAEWLYPSDLFSASREDITNGLEALGYAARGMFKSSDLRRALATAVEPFAEKLSKRPDIVAELNPDNSEDEASE